jgi:hypothetical protein
LRLIVKLPGDGRLIMEANILQPASAGPLLDDELTWLSSTIQSVAERMLTQRPSVTKSGTGTNPTYILDLSRAGGSY